MKRAMAYVVAVLSCTALFSFPTMALSQEYSPIYWQVLNAYGYANMTVFDSSTGDYTVSNSPVTYGAENQWIVNMNMPVDISFNSVDCYIPLQTSFTLQPGYLYRIKFDVEIWDWIKSDSAVYMGFSSGKDYQVETDGVLSPVTINNQGHTYAVEGSLLTTEPVTANYMHFKIRMPAVVSFTEFYISINNAYIAAFDATGAQIEDAINNAVNEDFGYTKPDSPNTDEGIQAGNDLLDDMEGSIDDFCNNLDADTSSVVENVNKIGPVVTGAFDALPAPVTVAMSGSVVLLVIRKVVGR